MLELEFFRPGDDGAPDELIHEHNHGDHGGYAEKNGAGVTVVGGGLEIGSEAGQAKVAELFASHQKEPGSCDGHHGIPDQSDGGEGQFDLEKTLPPVETIDTGGFAHFTRDAF